RYRWAGRRRAKSRSEFSTKLSSCGWPCIAHNDSGLMNKDQLREYLSFYQDLGVGEVYRRTPCAPDMAAVSSTPAGPGTAAVRETTDLAVGFLSLAPNGDTLAKIQADISPDCKRCRLCEQRSKVVFGSGNEAARLVFVGEGPGADEDAQGLPFVGRAGQLLTQ